VSEHTVYAAMVTQVNGLTAERDTMREQIAGLVAERNALRGLLDYWRARAWYWRARVYSGQQEAESTEISDAPRYQIMGVTNSFCPDCGMGAYLLAPENWNISMPAFYLCGGCGYIGQIGVGPVIDNH